jgi:cobalt/nickel transport system permease protein
MTMHLGNGAITPECVALTYGIAAVGLGGFVLHGKTRSESFTANKLTLAAAMGCAIFAAQAINMPMASGISVHLVGGAILAWTLGPALGACTMAAVLLLQALLLGDGGIAALGANVLNMAIMPAGIVAIGKRANASLVSVGFAASAAVLLAAGLISIETAAFRPAEELAGWSSFAVMMVGNHALAGILEGATTMAIVAALPPVLVRLNEKRSWQFTFAGIATMLLLALALSNSSSLPDGYQSAATASGMTWLLK